MEYTISNLTATDKSVWQRLFTEYCQFYGQDCPSEKSDTVWQWLSDPRHPLQGIAAYDKQSQLVGIAHYQSTPLSLFGTETGYLADLYVDSSVRRQGVARLLHQAFINEGKRQNWPFTAWLTQEGNQAARNLYDQSAELTDLRYYVQPVSD